MKGGNLTFKRDLLPLPPKVYIVRTPLRTKENVSIREMFSFPEIINVCSLLSVVEVTLVVERVHTLDS